MATTRLRRSRHFRGPPPAPQPKREVRQKQTLRLARRARQNCRAPEIVSTRAPPGVVPPNANHSPSPHALSQWTSLRSRHTATRLRPNTKPCRAPRSVFSSGEEAFCKYQNENKRGNRKELS